MFLTVITGYLMFDLYVSVYTETTIKPNVGMIVSLVYPPDIHGI